MSVSKWAYEPEKCDGDYCVGDCDFCHKAEGDEAGAQDLATEKDGTPAQRRRKTGGDLRICREMAGNGGVCRDLSQFVAGSGVII